MSDSDFNNLLEMLVALSKEQKIIVSKLCDSRESINYSLTDEEYQFLANIL